MSHLVHKGRVYDMHVYFYYVVKFARDIRNKNIFHRFRDYFFSDEINTKVVFIRPTCVLCS